jgi:glycosyltransferase 2 family protein
MINADERETFKEIDQMRSTPKNKLMFTFAKLFVTIILIAYLFSKLNFSVLSEKIETVRWLPLFLCVLVGHADRLIMAFKWRFLIQSSGVSITLVISVIITYMGNFAGQFLPAGVGEDITRIFLLRNLRLPATEVTSSIAVERIFGLTALLVTSLLSLFAGRLWGVQTPPRLGWILMGILAFMLIFVLLSFTLLIKHAEKWHLRFIEKYSLVTKIYRVIESYHRYSKRKKILTTFFLLSIIEVIFVTVVFYFGCQALYIDIAFVQLLMVIPIVLLVQRIPVSINGIGVQEGMMGYYFLKLGHSLESAVLLSLMLRVIQVIILAPGGFFYILRLRRLSSVDA